MLKFLTGLMLVCSSVFATETQLISLGQPRGGSFYLADNRNFLRNPALLSGYNQISYDVNAKDLILNKDNYVLAAGRLETRDSSGLFAYSFTDELAASFITSVENGKFFDDWGLALGLQVSGAEAYLKFANEDDADKEASDRERITGGLVLPFKNYTFFTEYSDQFKSDNYNFLVGLAYEFNELGSILPFVDLTYDRARFEGQGLCVTAGLSTPVFDSLTFMTAVKHNLVFKKKSTIDAGFDFKLGKDLVLGASYSLSALTKNTVSYKEFDTRLSLSFLL